ncbi:MAG: hypothetical protein OXE75_03845 [bacterium]|nr:hypothetical protein [bacterium]
MIVHGDAVKTHALRKQGRPVSATTRLHDRRRIDLRCHPAVRRRE